MVASQRCLHSSEHPKRPLALGLCVQRSPVLEEACPNKTEHLETQSVRKHCYMWWLLFRKSVVSPGSSQQSTPQIQPSEIKINTAPHPEAHLNWLHENWIHFLSQGMLFFDPVPYACTSLGDWSNYGKGAHWRSQFSFPHCYVVSRPVPQQVW